MKTNILFVCIENSNRSQMAQAFAIIHGKDRINAYSAGSKPSGIISPKAIASMKEIGYDLTTHQSKSLADIPQIQFDYVITMGCGDACPLVKAVHREDWSIPNPALMDEVSFRIVRKLVEQKVILLLSKIG